MRNSGRLVITSAESELFRLPYFPSSRDLKDESTLNLGKDGE